MEHPIHCLIIFLCTNACLLGLSLYNEETCSCFPMNNFRQLYHVDCSGKGLTKIPSSFTNIAVYSIDLSHNKLQTVMITKNYTRTLKELNLSYNELETLSDSSFKWIPYLKVLNLSNNNLHFSKTSLPDLVFQYLSNLEVLDLSFNGVKGPTHYNPEIFKYTTSLRILIIDGLQDGNFSFTTNDKRFSPSHDSHHDTYIELTKLTKLIVSGRRNRTKCSIKILSEGFFKSVSHLKYLDMSGCAIRSVDKESLSLLLNLQYLDLSYNELLSFILLRNISLPKSMKTLKLDKIHCTFGIGTYLTHDMVKIFLNSSIEFISLRSNRLEMSIENISSYLPPNLTYLDLADNKLTFGRYILSVKGMKSLKFLDLHEQHSTHFTGKGKDFVECYNTEQCSLTPPGRFYPVSTEVLSKYYSQGYRFYAPPLLETLDYSSSYLNSEIGKITLDPNNSVKKINLSHNFFQNLRGPVYGFYKIETVDFSHNFISNLSTVFFENGTTLKYLNFSSNLLGNCMSKPNSAYFKNLYNLMSLDLSSNVIRFAAPGIFDGLKSLEILNLSYNLLREFSIHLNQMPSLTTLDLSFNELLPFSDSTIKIFESRQQKHQMNVILTGNEIPCTCDSLNFLQWMLRCREQITINYSDICQNMHIVIKNSSDLEMISKTLGKKCDDYEEIIGVVSGLFVVFFAFIIGGIIHRYRWKLRYFYYMSKWSTTTSHKSYGKVYDYDAFVSYADEEKDFVIQEMTSELEEVSDLRLCLHERDFTPGKSIGENITKAICNSRKVLCVVTENFLCSQWCMYELEMALTDNRYSRDDQSVFLIMYGGLPTDSCKIRSSIRLMSLVKENAYLEYPNDESNRAEFWNSLRLIVREAAKAE
ncbi:toll-like receptor 4 [Magallana gigas]